jgi:ubiquinone/menaquinone biosynthesis C-methylase UbiE
MYKFLQKIYYRYFDIRKKEYKSLFTYFRSCNLILDVGCGIGDFAINDVKKIIGIDHNKISLTIAKKRGCQVVNGDILKMPFKDNFFDGVFCAHIIEHFNSSQARTLLNEINRVLKKRGIFVLQTPLFHRGFYNDFTHEKAYNPEAIMHYLSITPQTSFKNIGDYKIVRLKFRYAELFTPLLEPNRLPNDLAKFISIFVKVNSLFLYNLGIKNYFIKNGYTLILEKQ